MTFNETDIKEVLASRLGRRLLSCMLLVQPIAIKELQSFPNLAFELFNPAHSITEKKDFPNVAKISLDESYPLFKPIFSSNKELYNRVLKKAIDSELVLRIPRKKGGKKNYYYFINSDLIFHISYDIGYKGDKGIKIKENDEVFSYTLKHCICNNSTGGNTALSEKINAYRKSFVETYGGTFFPIYPLNHIFSLFWWSAKQPRLLGDTINVFRSSSYLSDIMRHPLKKQKPTPSSRPSFLPSVKKGALPINVNKGKNREVQQKHGDPFALEREYKPHHVRKEDLPQEWHKTSYLYKKAIQEGMFYREKNEISISGLFATLMSNELYLSFVPSYSIFSCFNNYRKHAKKIISDRITPMGLLEILTSEDYKILPERRSTVFTSILMYEKHMYTDEFSQGFLKNQKPSMARNTELAEEVILGCPGPLYPFLKSNEDKDKVHSGNPYILHRKNG